MSIQEYTFPVTTWNLPFNDSDIIYCTKEAEFIHNAFSTPGINTVCIIGDYGSGKTYLAKYYSKKYSILYPDGINYYSNFMDFYEFIESYDFLNEKKLIIADEISQFLYEDSLSVNKFIERLNTFKFANPNTHIILIGRAIPVNILNDCPIVKLSPVSHNMIYETAKNYLLNEIFIDSSRINSLASEIASVSEGNPRKLITLFSALKTNGFLPTNKIITIPSIVDAQGNPLKSDKSEFKKIKTDLVCANDEVVKYFSEHPEEMHKMTGTEFEYFVASVLDRLGYKTTVTPPANDGGVDIYAAKKENLGSFLFLIQCKHNKPHNPVGINIIRELYGVLNQKHATFASVFTTSYFSKPTLDFQKQFNHQLSLHDYNDIIKLLKELSN